jgi:hypothetical protein
MRLRVLCTILTLLMTAAIARQLTAQNPPPPPKLFASAADVTAMIAKAKAERKPDQPNFIQPIVGLAPYTANLEHRVAGIPAPASVHEREAEMFYVVEGSGRWSPAANSRTRSGPTPRTSPGRASTAVRRARSPRATG